MSAKDPERPANKSGERGGPGGRSLRRGQRFPEMGDVQTVAVGSRGGSGLLPVTTCPLSEPQLALLQSTVTVLCRIKMR